MAVYTPSRFEKICSHGSLFAQHIRSEGRMISDRAGWLESKLRTATVKKSYRQDAADSVNLALPMERFLEDELLSHNPIVADLAYVAVRNFAVCRAADAGELCFEYAELVQRLGREFQLSRSALDMLYDLRGAKTCYRSGCEAGWLQGTVGELRLVLSKFFAHRPLGQIEADAPVRALGGGYSMLRDIESSIVARLGGTPSNDDLGNSHLETVWKWIRNPRAYSWHVRTLPQHPPPRIELPFLGREASAVG